MAQKYRVEPPIGRRQQVVAVGRPENPTTEEWIHIGRLAEVGPPKEVRLDVSSEHVLAILGKRGSGKSFTLGSFLEGLCTTEPSTSINRIGKRRSALLFDTLNIFQWMVAPVGDRPATSRHVEEQARLLTRWNLDPVQLDIDLWVPAGFESRVTADARPFRIRTSDMEPTDWTALLQVDAMQDPMGQLVTQVVERVSRRGWTSADGSTVPPKASYEIQDLLHCLENDTSLLQDYARETVRAVRQRLSAYDASPLFGPTGTPLSELLQPGRLSIVLLSGIPDDVRLVIIFLTIRKLLFARAEASEATKSLELGFAGNEATRLRLEQILESAPPKTWVLVDEAQNIFPSGRRTTASDILLRFVREGRNFGLSLGFTTQQPSAIDPRIMAQVDTVIAHTLTVQTDVQNVLTNLKSRPPDRVQLRGSAIALADAVRQLDVGQAFVSNTEAERGFFMDVRPRTSIHGGFES